MAKKTIKQSTTPPIQPFAMLKVSEFASMMNAIVAGWTTPRNNDVVFFDKDFIVFAMANAQKFPLAVIDQLIRVYQDKDVKPENTGYVSRNTTKQGDQALDRIAQYFVSVKSVNALPAKKAAAVQAKIQATLIRVIEQGIMNI